MNIAHERPADELTGAAAVDAAKDSWMHATIRDSRQSTIQKAVVQTFGARLVGDRVIVDVTLADGATVTLRIAVGKVQLLADRLYRAVGIDRRFGKR